MAASAANSTTPQVEGYSLRTRHPQHPHTLLALPGTDASDADMRQNLRPHHTRDARRYVGLVHSEAHHATQWRGRGSGVACGTACNASMLSAHALPCTSAPLLPARG